MADGTKIEWADATLNYLNGCTVLSRGCTNCYAMKLAGTRLRNHPSRADLTIETKVGPVWIGEVRAHEPALLQALAWKRPRRIFWNAHGDTFHEKVLDAWIDRLFAVCALTPQHTHMILTKRPARMREYLSAIADAERANPNSLVERFADVCVDLTGSPCAAGAFEEMDWPLPNVFLGVSVEDQQRADERIPDLLATPAAVRFLSCEPLLGPIKLPFDPGTAWCPVCKDIVPDRIGSPHERVHGIEIGDVYDPSRHCATGESMLNWIIAGGESGPNARPMHPDWACSLRDQCASAGIPFHFKQWGEWAPVCAIDLDALDAELYHKPRYFEGNRRCKVEQCVLQATGRRFDQDRRSRIFGEDPANGDFAFLSGTGAMSMMKIGKKRAGRLLDGRTHDEFPQVSA